MPFTQNIRAFTLVELAIVITIIGLLIGGVLKGQELLDNSRVLATTNQLKAFEGAVTTFRDLYKAKPGDLATAQNFITGCTSANNCSNGNGDSAVGTAYATSCHEQGDWAIASEQIQFWKHLALANLITGVVPSAASFDYGTTNPTNPIVGGYSVISSTSPTSTDLQINQCGRFNLRWQAKYTDSTNTSAWAVRPLHAWQIDSKLDDGKPFTGSVRAGTAPLNDGACERDSTGTLNAYNPANRTDKCEFHIVLE